MSFFFLPNFFLLFFFAVPFLLHLSLEPSLLVCHIQAQRCSKCFKCPFLHTNPTPGEDLPVHPAQGELGMLITQEANVNKSKVPLKPELFTLLSLLGATLLLTVCKSQPSEHWNLITLLYSSNCYEELKSGVPLVPIKTRLCSVCFADAFMFHLNNKEAQIHNLAVRHCDEK